MNGCHRCGAPVPPSGATCVACGIAVEGSGDRRMIDDRYVIDEELGRGGMGVVYLATDIGLDRKVALKLIAPDYTKEPEVLLRFRQEAAALARFRNPHVVQVYAFGWHNRSPYIAMEYVRGKLLGHIIAEHRDCMAQVPVGRSLTVIRQIAHALDEVHAEGLVHRDVKPDNIIIEDDSARPVLIDFGLSGQFNPQRNLSVGFGTPQFMAPEQVRDVQGAPVTRRADVYSLACCAFELLTGNVPFNARTPEAVMNQQVAGPVPSAADVRGELAPFDPVLARALSKNPDERFATAGEFAAALCAAGARWVSPDARGGSDRDAAAASATSAIRILVVDDDAICLKFAESAAKLAFFRVGADIKTATGGAEAIALAQDAPPNLIILDHAMPKVDGVETVSWLRELPGGGDMRVIILSANVYPADRAKYAMLGVSDFLEKPIGLRPLVKTLTQISERSGWTTAEVARGDESSRRVGG